MSGRPLKRGDRIRHCSGEVFTYAGVDGSCAQLVRDGSSAPTPYRLWYVHEDFTHEDGTPVADWQTWVQG